MRNPFWLTQAQMARLRPPFPKSHGVPRVDDRRGLGGMIFINRNGLRLCDAPQEIGPPVAVWVRGRADKASSVLPVVDRCPKQKGHRAGGPFHDFLVNGLLSRFLWRLTLGAAFGFWFARATGAARTTVFARGGIEGCGLWGCCIGGIRDGGFWRRCLWRTGARGGLAGRFGYRWFDHRFRGFDQTGFIPGIQLDHIGGRGLLHRGIVTLIPVVAGKLWPTIAPIRLAVAATVIGPILCAILGPILGPVTATVILTIVPVIPVAPLPVAPLPVAALTVTARPLVGVLSGMLTTGLADRLTTLVTTILAAVLA